ncbi:Yip1 family protein [Archaeoglobus neptunius]|uniref:Yip1 family protein n=1 Tax=Archaeoglobus neptunius TaxID=2798580 RepID=UPI0019292E52|nr:YIP1 family protein [Archaeoglobus neptunius]
MDFLTNPDRFMERQKSGRFLLPVSIVAISAVISSATSYVLIPTVVEVLKKQLQGAGITGQQLEAAIQITQISMIISPFIVTFIGWLVISAILYVISGILGGNGSFSDLTKLVAFSYIPAIILSPVTSYLAVEQTKYALAGIKAYAIPTAILTISVAAWQAVYWAFAVKHARDLELRKSAMASSIVFIGYLLLTASSLVFSALSGTP